MVKKWLPMAIKETNLCRRNLEIQENKVKIRIKKYPSFSSPVSIYQETSPWVIISLILMTLGVE